MPKNFAFLQMGHKTILRFFRETSFQETSSILVLECLQSLPVVESRLMASR